MVEYYYDAWGNILYTKDNYTIDLAKLNPYRYRGYRYDEETSLYYLNSRYYNPEMGRFINSDGLIGKPGDLLAHNMYAYCQNNPVMMIDPNGNFGFLALLAITATSSIIGDGIQLISNAAAGKTGSELWRGVAGAAVGAGVNALALCLTASTGGASLFILAGASAIAQTGTDTIESLIRNEDIALGSLTMDFSINFTTSLAGNYIGSKLIPTNRGWFQTQKLLSVFTRPYGQKILLQSTIGSALSGLVNFYRKSEIEFKPIIPVPVVPTLPLPKPIIPVPIMPLL